MNDHQFSGVKQDGTGDAGPGTQTQQNQGTPQGGTQDPNASQQTTEQTVPLKALEDERAKRKKLEEQLFLYQLNPPQGQPQGGEGQQGTGQGQTQGQAQGQGTELPEFLAGMKDDDIINAGELKRALKGMKVPMPSGGESPEAQEQLGEQLVTLLKPDAQTIIFGKFRDRLRTEPHLVNFIRNTHPLLRALVAYRLGAGETTEAAATGAAQDLQQHQSGNQQGAGQESGGQQQNLEKVLENAAKPGATSAALGSGAMNQADRFRTMSDDELEAEISRVKGV